MRRKKEHHPRKSKLDLEKYIVKKDFTCPILVVQSSSTQNWVTPKLDIIAAIKDSNMLRMTVINITSILEHYYNISHEGLCEALSLEVLLFAFGSLSFSHKRPLLVSLVADTDSLTMKGYSSILNIFLIAVLTALKGAFVLPNSIKHNWIPKL